MAGGVVAGGVVAGGEGGVAVGLVAAECAVAVGLGAAECAVTAVLQPAVSAASSGARLPIVRGGRTGFSFSICYSRTIAAMRTYGRHGTRLIRPATTLRFSQIAASGCGLGHGGRAAEVD